MMELTNGLGADVFFGDVWKRKCFKRWNSFSKNTGIASILGVFSEDKINFEMNAAVFKNITIHTITGRKMFDTWYLASSWLKYKKN